MANRRILTPAKARKTRASPSPSPIKKRASPSKKSSRATQSPKKATTTSPRRSSRQSPKRIHAPMPDESTSAPGESSKPRTLPGQTSKASSSSRAFFNDSSASETTSPAAAPRRSRPARATTSETPIVRSRPPTRATAEAPISTRASSQPRTARRTRARARTGSQPAFTRPRSAEPDDWTDSPSKKPLPRTRRPPVRYQIGEAEGPRSAGASSRSASVGGVRPSVEGVGARGSPLRLSPREASGRQASVTVAVAVAAADSKPRAASRTPRREGAGLMGRSRGASAGETASAPKETKKAPKRVVKASKRSKAKGKTPAKDKEKEVDIEPPDSLRRRLQHGLRVLATAQEQRAERDYDARTVNLDHFKPAPPVQGVSAAEMSSPRKETATGAHKRRSATDEEPETQKRSRVQSPAKKGSGSDSAEGPHPQAPKDASADIPSGPGRGTLRPLLNPEFLPGTGGTRRNPFSQTMPAAEEWFPQGGQLPFGETPRAQVHLSHQISRDLNAGARMADILSARRDDLPAPSPGLRQRAASWAAGWKRFLTGTPAQTEGELGVAIEEGEEEVPAEEEASEEMDQIENKATEEYLKRWAVPPAPKMWTDYWSTRWTTDPPALLPEEMAKVREDVVDYWVKP